MAQTSDINYIFKFTWIIENLSLCPYESELESIISPEYIVENMGGSKWYVKLFPNVKAQNKKMCCFLRRSSDDLLSKKIDVEIKLEVEDSKRNILFSGNKKWLFGKDCSYGFPRMISNEDIFHKKLSEKDFVTIRCFMASKEYKNENFAECYARTKIYFDHFYFKWTLDGLDSTIFSTCKQFHYSQQKPIFEMTLKKIDSEEDFKIDIHKLADFEDFGALICRFAVLNTNGGEEISKQDTHWFRDGNQWQFPNFLNQSVLKKNVLMNSRNGHFELLCDVYITRKQYFSEMYYNRFNAANSDQIFLNNSEQINISDCSTKVYHTGTLIEDLKIMLHDDTEADVRLKISDKTFSAHKCVLAARSPVFKVMLRQNMSEKKSGLVEIPDVDSETLKAFLEYLYTGEITNMDAHLALKLILVAEKYQVEGLKKLCNLSIISALTDKNVCEVLLMSDMLGEESLQIAATNFIKDHVDEVLFSPEWMDFGQKHPSLLIKVTREIIVFGKK